MRERERVGDTEGGTAAGNSRHAWGKQLQRTHDSHDETRPHDRPVLRPAEQVTGRPVASDPLIVSDGGVAGSEKQRGWITDDERTGGDVEDASNQPETVAAEW